MDHLHRRQYAYYMPFLDLPRDEAEELVGEPIERWAVDSPVKRLQGFSDPPHAVTGAFDTSAALSTTSRRCAPCCDCR
ncbi:MAG: hypothetical protein M3003_04750 [Candidatus Dormibacteraeota bacterium]|nr:hypothetical protein [Candidatus Dormibacteraeota bacterium]